MKLYEADCAPFFMYVHTRSRACVRACVCICVSARTLLHLRTTKHIFLTLKLVQNIRTHTHIYIIQKKIRDLKIRTQGAIYKNIWKNVLNSLQVNFHSSYISPELRLFCNHVRFWYLTFVTCIKKMSGNNYQLEYNRDNHDKSFMKLWLLTACGLTSSK